MKTEAVSDIVVFCKISYAIRFILIRTRNKPLKGQNLHPNCITFPEDTPMAVVAAVVVAAVVLPTIDILVIAYESAPPRRKPGPRSVYRFGTQSVQ